ncbi:MAG: sigma 54-interacting transcriptional regulator [Desulfatiglandaceae bacterium]
MKFNPITRYQILLQITNAVITRTTREELFKALATELRKHIPYNRLSINLYDHESKSLSYFATADGIAPEGIACKTRRPLSKGSVTKMVIESGRPVIIEDLTRYRNLSSVGSMVDAGLKATMAFPLVIRSRLLGTIHFSFATPPENMTELKEVLYDISRQVAISVDNMLAYTRLKELNTNLKRRNRYLMSQSPDGEVPDEFVYASKSMSGIMDLVEQVAETDVSVLITGETGTGKDLIARHIHEISRRKDNLFVKINCPALAPSLFESELFGHAKGAFTGAGSSRTGRFEMADGGTVFLDEVGELPAELQAKLLHVIQDRRFEKVGESRSIYANFRVIAATNRDLEKEIQTGRFRQDLFYRLNTVSVHLPPLRDRPEDIPLIVRALTEKQAKKMNRPVSVYTEGAMNRLCGHCWPGNGREIKNLVTRMVILKPGTPITERDIEGLIPPVGGPSSSTKVKPLVEMERLHIEQALIETGGAVGGRNGAARLLGVPRSTLQYRIRKHGLDPRDYTVQYPR